MQKWKRFNQADKNQTIDNKYIVLRIFVQPYSHKKETWFEQKINKKVELGLKTCDFLNPDRLISLEIKKKSGTSINPDIHHSKVPSSVQFTLYIYSTVQSPNRPIRTFCKHMTSPIVAVQYSETRPSRASAKTNESIVNLDYVLTPGGGNVMFVCLYQKSVRV